MSYKNGSTASFERPNIDTKEFSPDSDTAGSKFVQKSKELPLFPIGFGGTVLFALYGAYNFKNRGDVSASVYLTKLRVKAQGVIVGVLTVGVIASAVNKFLFKKDK